MTLKTKNTNGINRVPGVPDSRLRSIYKVTAASVTLLLLEVSVSTVSALFSSLPEMDEIRGMKMEIRVSEPLQIQLSLKYFLITNTFRV